MMFRNLAVWDRALHVAVGLVMLATGWWLAPPGLWASALKLFGLFPIAAGLLGWDPLYALLHRSTGDR